MEIGVGAALGADEGIGLNGVLLTGSKELKEKCLQELASGQEIAAFGLTEPLRSSGANSIKSSTELLEDGKNTHVCPTKPTRGLAREE